MSRAKFAEDTWKRVEKVNAELFVLTYGSIVHQLCNDCEEYSEVNKQLDKMCAGLNRYDLSGKLINLGDTTWE